MPTEPEAVLWPEVLRRDAQARREALEASRRPHEPEVTPPPIVPARDPLRAEEYATSNRGMSAAKLGRLAAGRGWQVRASYWMAHDGAEGCAVRAARGPLNFVAVWDRAPGHAGTLTGWKTGFAYGWREGQMPQKVTITTLANLIGEMIDS